MSETPNRFAGLRFAIGEPIPLAGASLVRTASMDRMKMIENAAFEFGANKGDRLMFASKATWINGSLIEAGMKPLSDAERRVVESPDPEKVAVVTNSAGREYDAQSGTMQRLCSREAFIQNALHEAGLVQVIA